MKEETIIEQTKKFRIIFNGIKYSIQGKYWFKWRTITFGPYYPMKVGYRGFYSLEIAKDLYKKLVDGIFKNWKNGI